MTQPLWSPYWRSIILQVRNWRRREKKINRLSQDHTSNLELSQDSTQKVLLWKFKLLIHNLLCFCKPSSALQICLLDSVYRLMGLIQWLSSSWELYGNCLLGSVGHHWPSNWHTVFANKYLLNCTDLPCFWTPQSPWLLSYHIVSSCLSGPSFSIFFSSASPLYKRSIHCSLLDPFSSLNPPSLVQLFQLLSTGWCLTNTICISVSQLRFKLTWSDFCWNLMSHMHSK